MLRLRRVASTEGCVGMGASQGVLRERPFGLWRERLFLRTLNVIQVWQTPDKQTHVAGRPAQRVGHEKWSTQGRLRW